MKKNRKIKKNNKNIKNTKKNTIHSSYQNHIGIMFNTKHALKKWTTQPRPFTTSGNLTDCPRADEKTTTSPRKTWRREEWVQNYQDKMRFQKEHVEGAQLMLDKFSGNLRCLTQPYISHSKTRYHIFFVLKTLTQSLLLLQ